ncbi:hypothetical protein pb186bvf_014226 [Paramecium bursaria]
MNTFILNYQPQSNILLQICMIKVEHFFNYLGQSCLKNGEIHSCQQHLSESLFFNIIFGILNKKFHFDKSYTLRTKIY